MANNTTCIKPMAATSNGVWQGDNPINFSLPLLIVQICLVLVVTRTLAFMLKPLRQPRVIAEIIGGVLLGPSVLGRNKTYLHKIFPKQSVTLLETIADIGLVFFLFMVGLELDLAAIRKTGKEALSIAAAGISLPFVAGVGVSFVLRNTIEQGTKLAPFLVFMGVALSITAFPVLARILAERKLLTTDVGQMAMSAAAVNDVVAWILLALAIALSGSNKSPSIAAWVFLCGLSYVVVMFTLVKPVVTLIARQAMENEPVNELHVCITLAGVLAAGFVTDAIGIHAIFGAFVFGLIVPKNGPFAGILIEKIEDLVTILMLPLYFASSGLKTNIGSLHGAQSFGLLVLIISTACVGKVLGTFAVSLAYKMSIRKSLTLGFLMNTKGLVELIVLNIGKDRGVLNDETFAIMVLMALFTTFMTTPVVMALYKPARNPIPYTRRKLDFAQPDDELRVLSCVHGISNVHAIINLVEASRGSRKRAVHLYILHLIEFSERPSSIMKVQRARRDGRPFWNKGSQERDNIVVAFEAYGQLSKVTVRPMTAISNFADMHEDICTTAADKRAAIIILPFHKHPRPVDGVLESHNPGFRTVNQQVLLNAPCSVGILIDKGIGFAALPSSSVDQNVAVLFFGGPDDREALVFGYRMAEHPGVKLKVFRFVDGPSPDHTDISVSQRLLDAGNTDAETHTKCSLSSRFNMGRETYHFVLGNQDLRKEKQLDEECLSRARHSKVEKHAADFSQSPNVKGASDSLQAISYEEIAIGDPLEAAIGLGKSGHFNLLLVGRSRKPSPLLAYLARHPAESPELGPVGDALVSRGSDIHASILVIQQHDQDLEQESPTVKGADISTPKSSEMPSPSIVLTPVSLQSPNV